MKHSESNLNLIVRTKAENLEISNYLDILARDCELSESKLNNLSYKEIRKYYQLISEKIEYTDYYGEKKFASLLEIGKESELTQRTPTILYKNLETVLEKYLELDSFRTKLIKIVAQKFELSQRASVEEKVDSLSLQQLKTYSETSTTELMNFLTS